MNNNINLAEILKDCPQGMKLYSPMCGECTLDSVDDSQYAITVRVEDDRLPYYLTADGRYLDVVDAECVLFPSKDQRDWSKFHRPFVDGDIITCETYYCKFTAIFKNMRNNVSFNYHFRVILKSGGVNYNSYGDFINARFATEEEKQKLFQAIKDEGYKWNEETKTLEKLIEPKFKVGDKVRHKITNKDDVYEISKVYDDSYGLVGFTWMLYMKYQDDYELAPNKFDVTTLKPFDKVLVRHNSNNKWRGQFYMSYDKNEEYPFECTYNCWKQCIPYEGNEHLHDNTDDCDEYYKTWE